MIDLSKGWKYILNKYPEIDQERLVAAGASYGGYSIKYVDTLFQTILSCPPTDLACTIGSWIQGHQKELGFDFKAVVCHDGVFDLAYLDYTIDEEFFVSPISRPTSVIYAPRYVSYPQLLMHR